MDYTNLVEKLITTIKEYKKIIILIKGSPDPDAIASSFGIYMIAKYLGIEADIIATNAISLIQNRRMVERLDIPLQIKKNIPDASNYDSYVILDHQSPFVYELKELPCIIHIDHHQPLEKEAMPIVFQLIIEDVGSVSTIIALFLEKISIQFQEKDLARLSTALLYGIQTDTDKYMHAYPSDYDALNFLSPYSIKDILNEITNISFTKETIINLSNARKNQIVYKDWLISGIGIIDETERDSIAIVADFLLQRGKVNTVIIFALVNKENGKAMHIDASFRARKGDINLDMLIKSITPTGGGRKYKGAFQIDLNFFADCPDMEKLWELVNITTINKLKHQRDHLQFIELKGFANRIIHHFKFSK